MPIELVDTHCHLDFDVFDQDRDAVIDRARANGIIRILIPGIDIETSQSAARYANQYPEIYTAIGVHPNEGHKWKNGVIDDLMDLMKGEKVVAIGEIGLDFYRDFTEPELQIQIFKRQLELAAENNLPVVIHNRNADDIILTVLQDWHKQLINSNLDLSENPGVLHSFSGDIELARAMIEMNFRIGITGPVTFKNSQRIRDVISSSKVDNLLLETDAPFLAPHPFRGKRNEPANVRIVAEKIADLKGVNLEYIAEKTTTGAEKLFGWRNSP